MRTTLVIALATTFAAAAQSGAAPEGKKLPVVCVREHRLVGTNDLKHVDLFYGRGILKELTVTQEPRDDVAAGHRIVMSGMIISENTGFPRQGTLVFIGDASTDRLLLYALSDCDGRFRVRLSPEQLSDKVYLSERGLYRLLEYEIPEPMTKTENPNHPSHHTAGSRAEARLPASGER